MTATREPNGDRPPELTPSAAERCRTLVTAARRSPLAALATIARDPEGFPFASLVTVAADELGRPLLLLSSLAEHTQNLARRSDASLLLTAVCPTDRSPLAGARVTLLGACAPVPDGDRAAARQRFLADHPDAAGYADFKDFGFYRLEPTALRYVGGFGRMAWVSAEDYRAAEPDPLVPVAGGILSHMNADHGDAMLAYARALAGVADAQAATMTAVDRYGFDLEVSAPGGVQRARLAFAAPACTAEEVRRAMVAMAKAARAALG
jgi:putative heme iron utilization protein